MTIESLPDHIRRPHVRPVQPIPVSKDGKQFVALRDPAMLQSQTMVVPVPALRVLQQFRGEKTLEEIAALAQGDVQQLAELARALDRVGLLWGPTFEELESKRWTDLETAGALPPRVTSSLGESPDECRTTIAGYFEQTEDPELDAAPHAIVAPHLDYARGWPNYAAAYYAWQSMDAPDRVVVLGTNHFGLGDGVVLTQLGFETPMGRCEADRAVIDRLVEDLGRPVIADQLDHLPEHSIELQLPWIQYCFGDVPVVGALIPDPLVDMISDDGERVQATRFIESLASTLDAAGGQTLFIASSDLSHVGPQFGEPRPVDDQRRMDVERHDRDMMSKYLAGDPDEFVAAMRWNKNPTRWCSVGNMTALLQLAHPESIELIDYRQAYDERGTALVSSAAMTLS
jgi:AmmeMemoRadiSam system protein B